MADPEVDLFAGLKKKKKTKVNFDMDEDTAAPSQEEPSAEATPATEDGDMFADLKKKKKKKAIPMDLDDAPSTSTSAPAEGDAPAEDAELGDFGDLKKKKKKSKKGAFDLEAFEREIGAADAAGEDGDVPEDNGEGVPEGELGDDVFAGAAGAAAAAGEGKLGEESWLGSDRDYTYPELLTRFYSLLHAHNPELAGDKKRLTLVPPAVSREGTKKTLFANLGDICKRMHRNPKHVMEFLFAELGTSGSVDGSQRLVIKGRYTQKSMENVLRRYIVEYVVCKTCKSPDTLLNKENRLYFVTCESCGSRRSVAPIKTGFQAQIGRRIKPVS